MPVIDQVHAEKYSLYHADCMEVLPELESESIDITVKSPPFPELYQYSDDVRDMTNCVSYDESLEQYSYVVKEIARLTKPGRMSCVHCTDLRWGSLYQRDFPGDIVRIHADAGMRFFCRVTIWKDPWEFARRTRMRSLQHKTLSVIDAALSRIAPADYLLVFKKPGENAVPILHEKGFRTYAGGNPIPAALARDYGSFNGDPRENRLSHWIYRQYASPVWMDIRRWRMLPFEQARENQEERHACPLQLDVIERCLAMWSNPGETLLTPFAGVGSEVYGALINGRKAIGCELKGSYFRQACHHAENAGQSEGQQLTDSELLATEPEGAEMDEELFEVDEATE